MNFFNKKNKTEFPPNQQTIIRTAQFAGSFYPSGKKELNQELDKYLDLAKKSTSSAKPKILIVPHAGITYSGQTAAWGFKQLLGLNYKNVILLGASHQNYFMGAAVYDQGSWETPLGSVKVNQELVGKLIDENIQVNTQAHNNEHSLELELIFLQKVLANFQIVPILLGHNSDEQIAGITNKISQNIDNNTLLVISTDLSHYPDWETANVVDKTIIDSILTGDNKVFTNTIRKLENKGYANLDTCACGQKAISLALEITAKKSSAWEKLHYSNSGDISGDKNKVVGYVAIAAYERVDPLKEDGWKKEALGIARHTIKAYLANGTKPEITPSNKTLKEKLGAFVSLHTKDTNKLRGCIGRFEPNIPLYQVIQDMVIQAATNDSRFEPVTLAELENINIEISVLTPKQKIESWQDIQLGKHGVIIQKGNRGGTFLPQVAIESGWNLEEFLSQLCLQKAGLSANCYLDPTTNIYTFEAEVFSEN